MLDRKLLHGEFDSKDCQNGNMIQRAHILHCYFVELGNKIVMK